jgi:hypothetical protein
MHDDIDVRAFMIFHHGGCVKIHNHWYFQTTHPPLSDHEIRISVATFRHAGIPHEHVDIGTKEGATGIGIVLGSKTAITKVS